MKKLSLIFTFVLLAAALLAMGVFADDTFVIGPDNVESSEANATTFGEPIQLVDGNSASGGGWYNAVTSGWCGPNNAVATLVFDKEYDIVSAAFYGWSNSNTGITVTLYDANGNVTATKKVLDWAAHSSGEAVDLEFANVKAKSMTVQMGNNTKYDGNGFRIAEIALTALHVHEYTEPVEDENNVNPTCSTEGTVLHKCACGATEMVTVPATGEHTWDEGKVTLEPTDTAEGKMEYTCTVCGGTKIEKIQPQGHVWDEGTVVPPTCTEEGYTIYKCTDEGCEQSYTVDPVDALGHSYDEGVITVPATLTKEGEKLVSCTREGCDHTKTEPTPLATMADSSFVLTLDNIVAFEEVIVGDYHEKRNWQNLFDGNKQNASWSQSVPGGWFGLTGSSLTVIFDEEYYILGVDFYVWANYNGASIDFFDAAGNKVASYSNVGIQNTDATPTTILDCTNVAVKSMKISITGYQKGDKFGQCLDFQEFVITAHKHIPAEGQERYDEVEQSCTVNGSYKKFCAVCEKEVVVETGIGSHTLEVDASYPSGYDMNGKKTTSCTLCDYEEVEYLDALIESFGYSICQTGNIAIVHKFTIDYEAIEVFNSYLDAPVEIGVVAAATTNFEDAPLTLVEGKVEAVNSRISSVDLTTRGIATFEYGVKNLPERAYDLELALCAYISDGKSIAYIGYDGTTESPEIVAYSYYVE